MELKALKEYLSNSGINKINGSITQPNSYSEIPPSSLLAKVNRLNSSWIRAQYIIIKPFRTAQERNFDLENWKSLNDVLEDNQFLLINVKDEGYDECEWYNKAGICLGSFESLAKAIGSIHKIDHTHLQVIYYGAPGTGKSFEVNERTKGYSTVRTTFHPDSDYSTFVGAYKPKMTTENVKVIPVVIGEGGVAFNKNEGNPQELQEQRISYQFVRQAFLRAYLSAWKKYAEAEGEEIEPQFLVIEEINRGNCAQIFGDLFQLLDRDDNGFSKYPIEADSDLADEINKAFNEEIDGEYRLTDGCQIQAEGAVDKYISSTGHTLSEDIQEGRALLLPPNLYIWATMNTSDQSLFPIDSAFKRRWTWKYTKIAEGYERSANGEYKKDANGKRIPLGWQIDGSDYTLDWWEFVKDINKLIGEQGGAEDKKLGYFFCKPDTGINIGEETFVGKVMFYLWNDVFKDSDTALFKVSDDESSFDAFYTEDDEGFTVVDSKSVKRFLSNLLGNKADKLIKTKGSTADEDNSDTESDSDNDVEVESAPEEIEETIEE